MKERRLWYAVHTDRGDINCDYGSFDRDDAIKILIALNDSNENFGDERTAYISVWDADYNADGEPTCDPLCVEEITEDDI